MSNLIVQKVQESLEKVTDPVHKVSIIKAGLVSPVIMRDDHACFSLSVGHLPPSAAEALQKECQKQVESLDGVNKALIVLTKEKEAADMPEKRRIPHVKKIVMVTAGKGGVGKSTVALQLALSLKEQGQNVGIVDADIYGPSLPVLFSIEGTKPETDASGKMIPIEALGLQSMSLGYLIDPEKAAIWRGSMASKALLQLFFAVNWPEIDTLIVDMPPGTGDVPLTMLRHMHIDGAIMVSTPQDLALADVTRAYQMLKRMEVPVLGVIENMSFIKTDQGEKIFPFGKGRVAQFAQENHLKVLASLPLVPSLAGPDKNGFSGLPFLKGFEV